MYLHYIGEKKKSTLGDFILFSNMFAAGYTIFKILLNTSVNGISQEAACTLTLMLFNPDGPKSTPQMIYPNMVGNPIVVHSQPHGKDNIPIVTIS